MSEIKTFEVNMQKPCGTVVSRRCSLASISKENVKRISFRWLLVLAVALGLAAPLQAGILFIPLGGGLLAGPIGGDIFNTLRLTMFNAQPGPVSVRMTILDLRGDVLAQQNDNLPGRTGTTLDLELSTLGLMEGDRIELLARFRHNDISQRRFAVSLQIFDTATGETIVAEFPLQPPPQP